MMQPQPGPRSAIIRKPKETDLKQALIQFFKEVIGRGPEDTRAWLLPDMVLFRCRKVLLPYELGLLQLAECESNCRLVKQMRRELMEQHSAKLKAAVSSLLGTSVLSVYHDLSTTTDESIIVLTLGPSE